MQFRVRKCAHVLERLGLAMAGASSGLFVGAHVGSTFAALTSQSFLVAMMIVGAIAFYLGIDTPPLAFHAPNGEPSKDNSGRKIDAAEFLSAAGAHLLQPARRRIDLFARSQHKADMTRRHIKYECVQLHRQQFAACADARLWRFQNLDLRAKRGLRLQQAGHRQRRECAS